MNTVMFDLQAAVMAASVSSGGNGGLSEITEGGDSFSDVLAAQKELVTEGAVVEQTVEDGAEAEMSDEEINQEFSAILEVVENADEGMKKALMKLLETVLKAFRGSEDDKERKTDLFMIFSDGSAGMNDDDDDDMLISAELMCQTGLMIEAELTDEKAADEIIADLEAVIVEILGKDADETTAAEVLASMLNIPVDQLEIADEEMKLEAIGEAVELLTAPKQEIAEEMPEIAEKAEKLFAEFSVAVQKQEAEIPEMFRMNFTAVRINNAEEQVDAISGENSGDAEIVPEVAAANIQVTETVAENKVSEPMVIDAPTADSIEIQVREVVTEKLMSFESENGTEELTMILKPENLGEVAVKLVKENGAVTVLLSAQYEEVGKLISDRAVVLGSSLQSQNFNVKDIQVVAANNAAEQMGLDFTNQGFGFMNGRSNNQENSGNSYRGIDGIDGIEETEALTGTAKLKEAKLWTTA